MLLNVSTCHHHHHECCLHNDTQDPSCMLPCILLCCVNTVVTILDAACCHQQHVITSRAASRKPGHRIFAGAVMMTPKTLTGRCPVLSYAACTPPTSTPLLTPTCTACNGPCLWGSCTTLTPLLLACWPFSNLPCGKSFGLSHPQVSRPAQMFYLFC